MAFSAFRFGLAPLVSLGLVLGSVVYSPAVLGNPPVTEEIWISSVAWLDGQHVAATQSQGLLLRPGKLLRLAADQPESAEMMAEGETSLWSVVSTAQGVLVSDYKGRVLRAADDTLQPLEIDARWIRRMVSVPGQPQQVVAGTEDGKLIVLSAESNSELQRVEVSDSAIFDIAFHPDGSQLTVACGDGSLHQYSWPELTAVRKLTAGDQAIWSVIYVAGGERLLSGGADREIRLWSAITGEPLVVIGTTTDWITRIIPLGQNSLAAVGSMNGQVTIVDHVTMLPLRSHPVAGSAIWDMQLSPDGQRVAVGTRKHGLVIAQLADWLASATEEPSPAPAEEAPAEETAPAEEAAE